MTPYAAAVAAVITRPSPLQDALMILTVVLFSMATVFLVRAIYRAQGIIVEKRALYALVALSTIHTVGVLVFSTARAVDTLMNGGVPLVHGPVSLWTLVPITSELSCVLLTLALLHALSPPQSKEILSPILMWVILALIGASPFVLDEGGMVGFLWGVRSVIVGMLLVSLRSTLRTERSEHIRAATLLLHISAVCYIASLGIVGMFNEVAPQPYGAMSILLMPVAFLALFTFLVLERGRMKIVFFATQGAVFGLWFFAAGSLWIATSSMSRLFTGFTVIFSFILGIAMLRTILRERENIARGERLARYLANANARLREIDKQKTEFVSVASHQLRSPIAAIKGYSSMLKEGAFGTVPDSLDQPIERILESGNRIAMMVDDFLNVSRIEQGRMTYAMQEHDVRTVVESVVDELRVIAEQKHLGFEYHAPDTAVMVQADEGKLKQIFSNLIDNAIKYTREGWVHVDVEVLHEHKTVLVKVSDSGIGIAPEEQGLLFQKFNRASNANEASVYGTGLGLYIAREIMKAHNGWIHVSSPGVGKGSTFTVELPIAHGYVQHVSDELHEGVRYIGTGTCTRTDTRGKALRYNEATVN